jgi:hypothetical protein
MLEPISAAKLAAVIVGEAVGVLTFIKRVQDAPVRSQQLRVQLRTVVQLVEYIERMLKNETQMPIASIPQALTEFRVILDKLTHRLRESSTSGMKRVTWPFNETETERHLRDIEHYKTTFISFFLVHNV